MVVIVQKEIAPSRKGRTGGRYAYRDNLKNLDKHFDFYSSSAHKNKIKKVEEILTSFFKGKWDKKYINRREYQGHPLTVIKLENPKFPSKVSKAKMEELYYEPLVKLGVEFVKSKTTDSWLYRIR